MDKLKKIKIKQDDGTYSPEVPIGVDAENIDMSDGKTLPEVLGPINVDANGTIKHQFDELNKNKVDKDIYDTFNETTDKNLEKINENIKQLDTTIDNLILESGGDSNLEVVQARGTFDTLNGRLNNFDLINSEMQDNLSSLKSTLGELNSLADSINGEVI